jgi:DNA-binding transcriptional ArsR family regulator
VLTAMSHPLRRRLMTLLKLDGPSMASVLAQRTGQAVGNVSHHLHALAAAGLIEQAPELARDRRERWWRRTLQKLAWSSADFADEEATDAIARAVESLNLDEQVAHVRRWAAAAPELHAQWTRGPFSSSSWMRMTDDELAELGEEIHALLAKWGDREIPDDGQERTTVFAFARAMPARP